MLAEERKFDVSEHRTCALDRCREIQAGIDLPQSHFVPNGEASVQRSTLTIHTVIADDHPAVLALGAYTDDRYVHRNLTAGVCGYLLKGKALETVTMTASINVIASSLANRTQAIDRNRVKVIQNRRTNMTSGICGTLTSGVECY